MGVCVLASVWAIVKLTRRGLGRAGRHSRSVGRQNWIKRAAAWLAMRVTGRGPDPAGMIVEFYEQFLALTSAAGFARRADQTQREFAWQIEKTLGHRLAAADLSRFPSELAELFYRVRFGSGRLEPIEADDIEHRLIRLEAALGQS